jgi:nucleotide-binding universal stress UspA family protein
MTEVLIGATNDATTADAAALGLVLARTLDAAPVIAHIRPEPWRAPGPGQVDAEWNAYLDASAVDVVTRCYSESSVSFTALGGSTVIGVDRHSGAGLDALANERGSAVIVIGSVPGPERGRFYAGSTSDQLLHGASVPVALAPWGYASVAPEQLRRVVVAIETAQHPHQVQWALDLAAERDLEVAFVSIVRRATSIYTTQLGHDAEIEVLEVLTAEAEITVAAARAANRDVGDTYVLQGDTVAEALASFAWRHDDVLAVGSSSRSPIARVLLGDMTFRIVRAASVPVIVLPRVRA